MAVHDKEVNNQSWQQWRKWIYEELKRHAEKLETIEQSVNDMKVEIAMLKVKSGIWGLIGGCIPVAIFVFINVLKR